MNDSVELYYNPMSRARIVEWGLEEVNAPYKIKLISFEKGEGRKPEFLAINPMGKVPTIIHRGVVITETGAILTYLGDAFPNAKLAPAIHDPRRGVYLRWMFFTAGCYESAVLEKTHPRTTPARPSMLGFGSYEDVMNTIESALNAGPFLLGDQFTLADLYLSSQLGWSLMFKTIEARPAFTSYVERCESRPAAIRANEKANEIMKKMETNA